MRGTLGWCVCGQGRGRTADLSLFRRALVPTELPAPIRCSHRGATLTGLEPATSAVTGRRANQLRYRALLSCCAPNGVRTRATALKGRRPGPLDDGGSFCRGQPERYMAPATVREPPRRPRQVTARQ